MVLRGVAGDLPRVSARRHVAAAAALVVVLAALMSYAARAGGAEVPRCDRFHTAATERAQLDTGSGPRVVVIGDSYSVGLGLDHPGGSWPTRLPGEVHVAGFSGSGFSEGAGHCPGVSFAERAPAALRGGADLVVVEGGLNDVGESSADIAAGFRRLLSALEGHRVVVVGPPAAPSRAGGVPRVDALLADLAEQGDVAYIRTRDLALDYLDDDLHLTPAGHKAFGDAIAAALVRPGA